MVVTVGNEITTIDRSGKKLHSFTHKQLRNPTGVAVDGPNIYITDAKNNSLLKFDETGKLLKSVGQEGSGEGEFNHPAGLTVVGDEVIVCDFLNYRLQVFTSDLVFVGQFGSPGTGNGQFAGPFDVTHDQDGNLYVTDTLNRRIQVFNTQGKFLCILVAPGHINKPSGIALNRDIIYVSEWIKNGNLHIYHKNGDAICSIPCEGSKDVTWGIAVDLDQFIYISDTRQVIVW